MLSISYLWIILTEIYHSGAPRVNKKGTQVPQRKNLVLLVNKIVALNQASFTQFCAQEMFLKLPINSFILVECLPPHPGGLVFLLHYPFLPHKITLDLLHKYHAKMSMSLVITAHFQSLLRNILMMQWECCSLNTKSMNQVHAQV